MKIRLLGFAFCVLVIGCGDRPSREAAGEDRAPATSGLVARSAIDTCAGMTPASAETLLGAEGRGIKDMSRPIESRRQCVFSTDVVPYVGLSFELSPEPTVEAARRAMADARQSLTEASGVIDAVTKSGSKRPAIEEVPGIGDEAFVAAVNDILVFRVGNVMVELMTQQTLEARQRVAQAVEQGLR